MPPMGAPDTASGNSECGKRECRMLPMGAPHTASGRAATADVRRIPDTHPAGARSGSEVRNTLMQ